MAIYRGNGGSGDATGGVVVSEIGALTVRAEDAEVAAVASAAAAATSATNASSSASSAASSASSASLSATNASTSATNASTYASNASTSATNAANSATSASSSASSATASASAALTSETNAATSASNAATSATNAAASAAEAATYIADQTGNAGKFLQTDGTSVSWQFVSGAGDVIVDGDFVTAGLMASNGAGVYSVVTDNSANWNTAYGWGNHASAGYLTSFTETDPVVGAISGIVKADGLGTISAAVAGTDYLVPSAIANMLETSDIGVTVQGYSSVLANTTASFTTADETKLDGIAAGAEVNVNADWSAVSGDAQILNKPTLATVATTGSYNDLSDKPTIPAAYTNSDVDAHLNTSTATTGEVLSWNGTDYDWTTPPAGYSDSDVDTHLNTSTATTDQVLSWSGTDYAWVDQSGGASYQLYAENPVSPTAPSATGTNAVAIGSGASASNDNSFSFGIGTASGVKSITIGEGTNSGSQAVYIGWAASTVSGSQAVGIGRGITATGTGSLALGGATSATSSYASAIGRNSSNAGSQAVTGSGAMALGGSYASGTDSFAGAIANNTSTYGATGANSVAVGRANKASTTYAATMGGYLGVASAYYSTVLGGRSNSADGQYSVVSGYGATANGVSGKKAHSPVLWASAGGTQTGELVLLHDTTDATATVLTSTGTGSATTNQVILPNNSAYAFHGTIVARQQASGGTASAAWKVEGLIRREGSAGTTVLVNSATTVIDNTPGWTLALSADTTNGGLAITATGAAATNIRWVATIQTSEVTYA